MQRAASFKQVDLTRAIKAARKADIAVREAVISPAGEIRIIFRDGAHDRADRPNDFDRDLGG